MTEEKIPKLQFGMFLKIDGFVRLNTRMKKVKVNDRRQKTSSSCVQHQHPLDENVVLCSPVRFRMWVNVSESDLDVGSNLAQNLS